MDGERDDAWGRKGDGLRLTAVSLRHGVGQHWALDYTADL